MAEYLEIVVECAAHTSPNPQSPALYQLSPGTVVKVLRDEDKNYLRVAFAGHPVYVPRESVASATEEAFLGYQSTKPEVPAAISHTSTAEGEPASFGIRFGATTIDAILWNLIIAGSSAALTIASVSTSIRIAVLLPLLIGGLTYFLYLNAHGGTLGKRFVGIRIVKLETGGAPGWGTAIVRQVAAIVSGIPLYLGYFWMIWDKEKRTWHDHVAGTMVVTSNWHSREL